ncbi:hypothetical protein BJ508DRAFT_300749 [Ascobolus immersus RN42]|uniref:Uncharacterized protein n=1 Tax=Ascobolus immersus RN42 TaxID=1160509 RepID=A0A3N4IMY5_ASCIM|nr:hypothetical protein BJ508DRAFT_300749 [Ascobolus immersus RN42]
MASLTSANIYEEEGKLGQVEMQVHMGRQLSMFAMNMMEGTYRSLFFQKFKESTVEKVEGGAKIVEEPLNDLEALHAATDGPYQLSFYKAEIVQAPSVIFAHSAK